MTATVYTKRDEEERRLLALKEQYRHEFLDEERRCELLNLIVRLERKLGRS